MPKPKSIIIALTLVGTLACLGCGARNLEKNEAPGYGRVPGTGLEYFCDEAHGNLVYFTDPVGSAPEYEWLVWGGCSDDAKPSVPQVIPDNP
jgi:hypothetical protein